MRGIAWWPVTLVLLAAPFGVWGWGWLDKQRIAAVHAREIAELQKGAAKQRDDYYALGKRDGIAEVRDAARTELEQTKAALEEMEYQLEVERAERPKAPEADKAVPPPDPAIVELCKRSASCRERRALK
jgi:hypothetical protein